jgi:hypothetical protein
VVPCKAVMRRRRHPAVWAAVAFAAWFASASAQGPLRTAWGDPDLQGVWPSGNMIAVPFERPASFGTRATLTDAEFAERAAVIKQQAKADAAGAGESGVNPASYWLERGAPSRQASLIVDPPDGRLPPMTADGAQRARAWPSSNPPGGFASAAEFNVYDRCITRGVLGSTFPNIYGSGMEIMQAPGLVVIRYEMIHESRIIPLAAGARSAKVALDDRPHLSPSIRSYMGDPRGHWDGNTLVIQTRNFNGKTGSYARNGNGNPTSEALTLIERFRRVDADTIDYRVTVDDSRTWTRPWTVALRLTRDPGYVIHEYACHEGNYAIANMLRIFRAAER